MTSNVDIVYFSVNDNYDQKHYNLR